MASLVKGIGLLKCFPKPTEISVRYKIIRRGEKKPKDLSWTAPLVERYQKRTEGSQPEVAPEPAKLHLIWRVKDLKGRPYWEKNIAKELGVDEKMYKKQIVKNTPGVNERLSRIKHLIKIVPVTFPYGLPESESDYEHCYMKDNGEFVVKKTVEPLSSEITVQPKPDKSVWTMDKATRVNMCKRKLSDFDVAAEYNEPKYVYKHNQDGKEYRYFGDKSMDGKRENF